MAKDWGNIGEGNNQDPTLNSNNEVELTSAKPSVEPVTPATVEPAPTFVEAFKKSAIDFLKGVHTPAPNLDNQPLDMLNQAKVNPGQLSKLSRIFDAYVDLPTPSHQTMQEMTDYQLRDHLQQVNDALSPLILNKAKNALHPDIIAAIGNKNYYELKKVHTPKAIAEQVLQAVIASYGQRIIDNIKKDEVNGEQWSKDAFATYTPKIQTLTQAMTLDGLPPNPPEIAPSQLDVVLNQYKDIIKKSEKKINALSKDKDANKEIGSPSEYDKILDTMTQALDLLYNEDYEFIYTPQTRISKAIEQFEQASLRIDDIAKANPGQLNSLVSKRDSLKKDLDNLSTWVKPKPLGRYLKAINYLAQYLPQRIITMAAGTEGMARIAHHNKVQEDAAALKLKVVDDQPKNYAQALKENFFDFIQGDFAPSTGKENIPADLIEKAKKGDVKLSRFFDNLSSMPTSSNDSTLVNIPLPTHEKLKNMSPNDMIDHLEGVYNEVSSFLLNESRTALSQDVIDAIGQDNYQEMLIHTPDETVATQIVAAAIMGYGSRLSDQAAKIGKEEGTEAVATYYQVVKKVTKELKIQEFNIKKNPCPASSIDELQNMVQTLETIAKTLPNNNKISTELDTAYEIEEFKALSSKAQIQLGNEYLHTALNLMVEAMDQPTNEGANEPIVQALNSGIAAKLAAQTNEQDAVIVETGPSQEQDNLVAVIPTRSTSPSSITQLPPEPTGKRPSEGNSFKPVETSVFDPVEQEAARESGAMLRQQNQKTQPAATQDNDFDNEEGVELTSPSMTG